MQIRNLIAILIVLVCIENSATAAEIGVSTSPASSSRYEIVQSQLTARDTFRLDKVCGLVWQMVTDTAGELHWQEIPFFDTKLVCASDGRVRYQLFISAIAARYTFLINTDSGKTWHLVVDSQKNSGWQDLQ